MDILNLLSPICDCLVPVCDCLLPNNPPIDELVFDHAINDPAALPNNQTVLNNAADNSSAPIHANYVDIKNNLRAIANVVNEAPNLLNTVLNASPEVKVDETSAFEGLRAHNNPTMLRIVEETKGNSSEPVQNGRPAKFVATSLDDFTFDRR